MSDRAQKGDAMGRARSRALALVVAAAALGGALLAGHAAGPVPAAAQDASVLKTRLSNGVTVLVRENHASPVVAVSLFVRMGTGWETEADSGIGNLLQQVMTKGTQTRSAMAIAEAADDFGGSVSASADVDSCEIRGAALARRWRDLVELIADIALRPSLPADEVEAERRVALRSIRNRQDQAFPLAMDTLSARLYGPHPYARPSVGRAEAVERIDREALRAHFERFYRGGGLILSVSGDVVAGQVTEEAARLFGAAPVGAAEGDPRSSTPVAARDRVAVVRQSAQTQVLIGFLAPPVAHPDYAPVKVLSAALGGGMAGRLFTELRDKQGLAYSTSAIYPTRVGPSFLLAQFGTAPTNAQRAEEAMSREIDRIRREPVGEAELARAKTYLMGQFALDRRTNARLAWYAAFFEAAGVGHDFPERYGRMVEAVTAADVQRVAAVYLASPTIVSVGPPAP